jgi:hypothetical protein
VDTEGCNSTEIRFIKVTSAGVNTSFLPDLSPCVSYTYGPWVSGSELEWSVEVDLEDITDDRVYLPGSDSGVTVRVLQRDFRVNGDQGGISCRLVLGFDPPTSHLGCELSLRTLLELAQLDVPAIIDAAKSEGIESQAVLIYQAPELIQ